MYAFDVSYSRAVNTFLVRRKDASSRTWKRIRRPRCRRHHVGQNNGLSPTNVNKCSPVLSSATNTVYRGYLRDIIGRFYRLVYRAVDTFRTFSSLNTSGVLSDFTRRVAISAKIDLVLWLRRRSKMTTDSSLLRVRDISKHGGKIRTYFD